MNIRQIILAGLLAAVVGYSQAGEGPSPPPDDIFDVLMSWAVTLSGYPKPAIMPQVISVDHVFFVENACGKRECKVWGWYSKGTELYVDKRADPRDNLLQASIVVHEMVHYLQGIARNGNIPPQGVAFSGTVTCGEVIGLEREAYAVQKEFLLRYGVYQPVGMSMARVGCNPDVEKKD